MKKLILFGAFFWFSACSKIETGLSLAPHYLGSQIDDAFDFKSEKLSRIRKQLDADIQESKKTLAKKLYSHIEKAESLFYEKEPTVALIKELFDDVAETQTALFAAFKASADVALKDLSEKEMENFKRFTEKKYAEELELSKDKKAFLKKRKASFLKAFKFFLDDLSSDQEKMIVAFVERNLDYFSQRIVTRQNFSDGFYIKMKNKEETLDFFLSHYAGKKLDLFKDLDQKQYLLRFFEFQIQLWKTTSSDQKKYLKKVLEGYKQELKKLST